MKRDQDGAEENNERVTKKTKDVVDDTVLVLEPKIRLTRGLIKVAKYYPGKSEAKSHGFKNVLIHTTGDLSPYVLQNERGQLLENVWQFSKLYARVSAQRIPASRWKPDCIIWEHPEETHLSEEGIPTLRYWLWRKKGMNNKYAVRYPNGYNGRHKCVCSIIVPDGESDPVPYKPARLDYIEARKRIYCAEYARLAPHTTQFKELKFLLECGVNLQLLEVDGPDPELTFPPYDRISKDDPGLLIEGEEIIKMLLNDSRKPFGHGYTIAALLLGGANWLT